MTASAVERLSAEISKAIFSGELPAGTWLRQDSLAQRFNVSRQPVREALRELGSQRLVEIHPRRGARVRLPSPREIREAYLVRADLEGLAAELAAGRISRAQLRTLDETRDRFEQLADRLLTEEADQHTLNEWADANDSFHETVLLAAQCEVLARTVEHLHLFVPRQLTRYAIDVPHVLRENVAQHADIHEAISAGDLTVARERMQSHIRASGELIAMRMEIAADGAEA